MDKPRRNSGRHVRGVLGAIAEGKGKKCPHCKQFAPLRPDGKFVCPLCGRVIGERRLSPTS